MIAFLNEEYFKQVQKIANTDEEFQIKAKGFTGSFTFKAEDKESLPPIYVMFQDGKVTEVRKLKEGEDTDYALEGPYETWVKVNKGELDGANAIMTREIRFLGSMSSIMRYSKAFLRLFTVMSEVPVEY
jgi:putative sterol carrier protein